MKPSQQQTFSSLKTPWQHRYCHGGAFRKSSKGRGARPLSSQDPLHLVFKVNKAADKRGLRHPRTFALINSLLKKYSAKFFVKIEQFSVAKFFSGRGGSVCASVDRYLHETT